MPIIKFLNVDSKVFKSIHHGILIVRVNIMQHKNNSIQSGHSKSTHLKYQLPNKSLVTTLY